MAAKSSQPRRVIGSCTRVNVVVPGRRSVRVPRVRPKMSIVIGRRPSVAGAQLRMQPIGERVERAVPVVEVAPAEPYPPLRLEADLGPRTESGPELQLDGDPAPQPRA